MIPEKRNTVNQVTIPDELKILLRWVMWRTEHRNDKPTKVPYTATTGNKADSTDPNTWTDYETALKAAESYDGIGVVLGDGLNGTDLDHCRNPKTGEIEPWAQDIIDAVDSYTEVSPSGTGVKIFCLGSLPPGGRRKGNVEMYDRGRYFTVTGQHLPGTPTTVNERTEALAVLHERIFPQPAAQPAAQPTAEAQSPDLSDTDLLERMFAAKNGFVVKRLWDGDRQGYDSQSEADQALCNHLAFWCGGDRERIDRMFRQSGLMRGKWERDDYRRRTIDTALAGRTEFYESDSGQKASPKKAPRSNASVRALCQEGESKKIICPRLAEHLHAQAPVFSLAGTLYRYQGGVYRPDGETSIRRDVSNILSESFTGHRANEVVAYLQDRYSVSADDIDADPKMLNVANGLLDVGTLEIEPHDPQYLSITQVSVGFRGDAQCPAIDKFFSEVFPPDCIGLAYELSGYCLRRDLEPRTATLLLGKTHAGKSTFLSLLTSLLGAVNVVNVELQDFAEDPFATAQLFGKLINTFADIPATPLRRSSIFKALTGGDRISAQEKHRRRFDFKPTTKLIFSANQPPGTRDYSDAYYVRWCVIPFSNQFLGKAEDTDLLAKLTTKQELEGLLIAALKAARAIPATGRLSDPGSVQQAKTMFREATDTVATFVRDVCEVDAKEEVGRQFLWETEYKSWCGDNGFKHLSQQKFNERLKQVVPSLQETAPRSNGRRIKSWSGIGLRDKNNDWPEELKADLFE